MEIKNAIKSEKNTERRGPDSESNMRYFKIPPCRNSVENVRDRPD